MQDSTTPETDKVQLLKEPKSEREQRDPDDTVDHMFTFIVPMSSIKSFLSAKDIFEYKKRKYFVFLLRAVLGFF